MVCTYNQENFLSETLESIISQDFPVKNYEIIVGEDASTDKTAQVLKNYAAKYPQIVPIYNAQNLGVVKNYFNVLKHCCGKYIMGCAGDDFWLPDKMRFQFDFMEENPEISMIYGNWYYLQNESFLKTTNFVYWETFDALLKKGNSICAPSTCWRREFWAPYLKEIAPENRGWFCEDFPLWLYLARCGKIKHIDRDFCAYRVHDGNMSVNQKPEKAAQMRADIYEIQLLFAQKYCPEQLPIIAQLILQKEKQYSTVN